MRSSRCPTTCSTTSTAPAWPTPSKSASHSSTTPSNGQQPSPQPQAPTGHHQVRPQRNSPPPSTHLRHRQAKDGLLQRLARSLARTSGRFPCRHPHPLGRRGARRVARGYRCPPPSSCTARGLSGESERGSSSFGSNEPPRPFIGRRTSRGICGVGRRLEGCAGGEPWRLDVMTDAMTHRGPDHRGTFIGQELAFGARRLSICGRRGVATSRSSPRTRDSVACKTGELQPRESRARLKRHGHRFRSRCDTEILPHLYGASTIASSSGSRECLGSRFGMHAPDGAALARDAGVKLLYSGAGR